MLPSSTTITLSTNGRGAKNHTAYRDLPFVGSMAVIPDNVSHPTLMDDWDVKVAAVDWDLELDSGGVVANGYEFFTTETLQPQRTKS